MAIAVPAGAGISVAAMLSVGLLSLATAMVLFGLLKGYEATLGTLLNTLAKKVRGVRWVGGKIANALDDIDDTVKDAIGKAALSFEQRAAQFFHGAAWLWEATVESIAELARSTADAFTGLVGGEIPAQITDRTKPITDTLGKQNAWAKARDRALARQMGTGIDRLQRDLQAEKLARAQGIDAIDARVDMRLRGVEDDIGQAISGVRAWVGARVRPIEGKLATALGVVSAGALTAAAVRALDLRFPYYKCRNVKAFNRALCRGNPDLLTELLGLAALAAIAVNPRVVAKAGQEIAEQVVGLIDRSGEG